ncbi:MAG: hypothetical protein KatS3mg095_0604 [Candidatus Parcubacteria bacterium]|nr:MAG: hypothetical protein KatS3mg095_0604 [Candidatus Parcubacteria bacterium]
MIKTIWKKYFYYIVFVTAILVIVLFKKYYSYNITIDMKNLNGKNNQLMINNNQEASESSKLLFNEQNPLNLELSTKSDPLIDSSKNNLNLNQNKTEEKTTKTEKITNSPSQNIIALKCQPLKNKDRVFFFKTSGLYGEIYYSKVTSFLIFYDNCFWLWANTKKTGLKICSKEIDVPLSDLNLEVISDDEINMVLKERKIDLYCSKTQINEKKFKPPTNIDFLMVNLDQQNLQNLF